MSRKSVGRQPSSFRPSAEQLGLRPPVSGNAINGLGELRPRRPTPLYWHPKGLSPYFEMQQWMAAQGAKQPELLARRADRARIMQREPAPVAPVPRAATPAENARDVKQWALAHGAGLVGIAAPRPEWIFEGYEFAYPWLVLIGVAMDYERLATAPQLPAALAVVDGYTKGWEVARAVADAVHGAGWRAEAFGGPLAGAVNLIPAAIACGFGELGKHGSIISRELGSNFRIACVYTDMPLVGDTPADIGAEDFCTRCQVCVNACPVDAISNDKQMVRGVEKWYVDFDRCVPYFNETHGCGVCIAVCPRSMPGRGPAISAKMLRRRAARGPHAEA
jgi:epoxyqueuosine reductase